MSGVVVLETLRRQASNLLAVVYVAFLMILGLASSRLEAPLWATFLTLLAIVTGAGLIGPEFSSGTLQLILVKPINRSVYLVSRFAGVVLFLAIAATLAFSCEAIGRLVWGGADRIKDSAIMLLNAVSDAALICALMALFGSFLRAYFNVALYWVIQILLGLIESLFKLASMAKDGFLAWLNDTITSHPIIPDSLAWLQRNLYPDAPQKLDRDWLLMVWSNVAIAIVLACFIFRRREVPYGAD